MNKPTTKLIAAVILISTAVSSLAAETKAPAPLFPTPTVVTRQTTLSPADLVKYQHLAVQSQGLATQRVAGASDTGKTVLIVVGTVVVIVGVVALVASHGGDHFDGPKVF